MFKPYTKKKHLQANHPSPPPKKKKKRTSSPTSSLTNPRSQPPSARQLVDSNFRPLGQSLDHELAVLRRILGVTWAQKGSGLLYGRGGVQTTSTSSSLIPQTLVFGVFTRKTQKLVVKGCRFDMVLVTLRCFSGSLDVYTYIWVGVGR